MFETGDIIDGKYRVTGVCSDTGGMGVILFIDSLGNNRPFEVVLKYCREKEEEQVKRFRREVRLLASFAGNSKIVQIVDCNLDHDPPYFVMKYYDQGDLTRKRAKLQNAYEEQEQTFIQMIDCLQELHAKNEFHRDLKPENFLVDDNRIVLSDLGLAKQVGSATEFTRTSQAWGTLGYIPPEFLNGGFKNADAAGDIFMLGKTIYALLSNRDPMYLSDEGIPAPVFRVIERCCEIDKARRYQSLAELKQALVAAYDVVLGRADLVGKARQLLSEIDDRLERDHQYDAPTVSQFVEQLVVCDVRDQISICRELTGGFFTILSQSPLADRLPEVLDAYEKLVESQDYNWPFAETIADNMRVIFGSGNVGTEVKARALDLAIRAADYMNRYAAMDTCVAMVASVRDEPLGLQIAPVLMDHRDTFVANIEPSQCHSNAVRNALSQLK